MEEEQFYYIYWRRACFTVMPPVRQGQKCTKYIQNKNSRSLTDALTTEFCVFTYCIISDLPDGTMNNWTESKRK